MRFNRAILYRFNLPMMVLLWLTASCITDHLDACPNRYVSSFRYTMNLLDADAFPRQVSSVMLYAFDSGSGQLAFAGTASGKPLETDGYMMNLNLRPGTYDVVVWGGLIGNDSFAGLPETPHSIEDLRVRIASGDESDSFLNPIFHGRACVTLADNNLSGSTELHVVEIDLVKNTNIVNVNLVRVDGAPLRKEDFSVRITSENALMEADNSVSGRVVYSPWTVNVIESYKDITTADASVISPCVHSSELSVGRLMADARSSLEVFRTSDGVCIASLPFEENILLYRHKFYSSMSPQEYLDRMDTCEISLMLTADNSWNSAAEIYINKWATVPVQFIEW